MTTIGRWDWKDETNSLEFIVPGGTDKKSRKQTKERVGSGIKRPPVGAFSRGRRSSLADHISQNKEVKLEDVKNVARGLLAEMETIDDVFDEIFTRPQLDSFLLCLLNYFESLNAKIAFENRPRGMVADWSQEELSVLEEMKQRIDIIKKVWARSYCVLVLGLGGMSELHHMNCGKSRVSSMYKDRYLYETLYSFCTYIVWVTFKRNNFEMIKKEIGRILRGDSFNPSAKVKPSTTVATFMSQATHPVSSKKDKPVQRTKTSEHQMPIKKIMNDKSPLLQSLLPNAREDAQWLFGNKTNKDSGSVTSVKERDDDFQIEPIKNNPGIIGDSFYLYNAKTLAPLEENDIAKQSARKGEDPSQRSAMERGTKSRATGSIALTEEPKEEVSTLD